MGKFLFLVMENKVSTLLRGVDFESNGKDVIIKRPFKFTFATQEVETGSLFYNANRGLFYLTTEENLCPQLKMQLNKQIRERNIG